MEAEEAEAQQRLGALREKLVEAEAKVAAREVQLAELDRRFAVSSTNEETQRGVLRALDEEADERRLHLVRMELEQSKAEKQQRQHEQQLLE